MDTVLAAADSLGLATAVQQGAWLSSLAPASGDGACWVVATPVGEAAPGSWLML